MRITTAATTLTACLLHVCLGSLGTIAQDFHATWDPSIRRVWAGPELWTNPLEDWRVQDGRLRCTHSGGDRNCVLLTRELKSTGAFEMSVRVSDVDPKIGANAWIGFEVGLRGAFDDYRDSAVRGRGFAAGVDGKGRLFIGTPDPGAAEQKLPNEFVLRLLRRDGLENELTLSAKGLGEVSARVDPAWLDGLVAIACSSEPAPAVSLDRPPPKRRPAIKQRRGGNARCAFGDWRVTGDAVRAFPRRAWGPVLWTQYTLSERVLTLTAQLAPIGNDVREVTLSYGKAKHTAIVFPLACTATFRVDNWDDSRDVPYSVKHHGRFGESQPFRGIVRKNPRERDRLVVAAFTGNNDVGFPHADVARHVAAHRPDFLFFSGDQVYEGVGGYGVLRVRDVERATLNYLRKWYLFGWAYRDLLRDRPSVAIPDDHDVFQSNIWGHGGRASPIGRGRGAVNAAQDLGGYTMPAQFVNAVQRTMTSHLPPPADPTPAAQGIGVYYTAITYGGISFAVIEDRKWKSGPASTLPAEAKVWNGWAKNPDWDARTQSDVPGAVLLGERQLRFLEDWAKWWPDGAEMKCVLSQTIFANVATLPPGKTGAVTPRLKIWPRAGYAEGEQPVQDHDSNGWPQSGRNRALRAMRKAFAFHIAGDQHLGSTVQYGVDDWGDAGFALCVPSVANVWPRRWFPPEPGQDRAPDAPRYTGKFFDGFGNRITVHAVSNPHDVGVKPARIHNRAPGYGIVEFDLHARTITCANWPRWVDPKADGAAPYPGWPLRCAQRDNYGRKPAGMLPTFEVEGVERPVFHVFDQRDGSLVYAIRTRTSRFQPPIFDRDATYHVVVGAPNVDRQSTHGDLRAVDAGSTRVIRVRL